MADTETQKSELETAAKDTAHQVERDTRAHVHGLLDKLKAELHEIETVAHDDALKVLEWIKSKV